MTLICRYNTFSFTAHPSHGLQVILVLKRRIINELLTSYLPSILILSIVYATNFFKPFFFESVISTNLTSQLVLTTLFISVSQSLPPTAYVKMIDLWLIFAQLIPFLEVVHLYIIYIFYKSYMLEGSTAHIHGCIKRR